MNEFRRLTPEEEQQYKRKKTLLTSIIVCLIIAAVLSVLIFTLGAKDAKAFKLFFNDMQVAVSNQFFIEVDGEDYIAAKELSNILNYTYQDGDYGSFGKSEGSAYIQNEYEVASFSVGSNQLKKYIKVSSSAQNPEIKVLSANGYCETTTLELPVIEQNGIIYIPLKCINDICNSTSNYQESTNSLYIQDLNYLINLAKQQAIAYKCDTISGDYENLRALPYGMMVVIDNDSYGVHALYEDKYIFGTKYDQVLFNQNVKEFLVRDSNSVGILNSEGESVVDINKNYESISMLSDKLGLYLVSEDGKYGVLSREGNEIVFAEYDSVGLNQDVLNEYNIKTEDLIYIPYDTMLVVKDDGRYGIYDVEDGEMVDTVFTGIGCIPKNLDRDYKPEENSDIVVNPDAEKTLLVDVELEDGTGIKGMVLKQFVSTENKELYGIYDSITGRMIIPCACTQIYTVTKNGRVKYYMEFAGNQLELVEYIENHPELGLEKYEQTTELETEE